MCVPALKGCMFKPLLLPWGLDPGREIGTQWRFSMPCSSLVVFSLLLCSHLSKLHKNFSCEWRLFSLEPSTANLSPSSLWSLPPKIVFLPGLAWRPLGVPECVFCFLGRELLTVSGLALASYPLLSKILIMKCQCFNHSAEVLSLFFIFGLRNLRLKTSTSGLPWYFRVPELAFSQMRCL